MEVNIAVGVEIETEVGIASQELPSTSISNLQSALVRKQTTRFQHAPLKHQTTNKHQINRVINLNNGHQHLQIKKKKKTFELRGTEQHIEIIVTGLFAATVMCHLRPS